MYSLPLTCSAASQSSMTASMREAYVRCSRAAEDQAARGLGNLRSLAVRGTRALRMELSAYACCSGNLACEQRLEVVLGPVPVGELGKAQLQPTRERGAER